MPTLPVLMARASTDPADARLLELLDSDLSDDARHAEALALLRAPPGPRRGPRLRRRPGAEAKAASPRSPTARSAQALEAFADVVATRSA